MPVRGGGVACEIFGVVAVRDHGDRAPGHSAEVRLDHRGDGQDGGRLPGDGLFHLGEPLPTPAAQRQVTQVVHLGPWIPEIGNPGKSRLAVKPLADQMHRLRRSRRNNHIHRMFLQVFLQETDARPHPSDPRIGDKEVGPHPERKALGETLPAAGNRGHDFLHVLRGALSHQAAVNIVGLPDRGPDDLQRRGDLPNKGFVHRSLLRILRGIDDRLPALVGQVFGEFDPTLDPRPSGRRPIIRDDQYPFHRKNCKTRSASTTAKPLSTPACGFRRRMPLASS